MSQEIFDKMVKCLELSSSNMDGEALSALRKANKYRIELKKSWDELLKPKPQPLSQKSHSPTPPKDDCDEIEEMFDFLHSKNLWASTKNFIDSLNTSYNQYDRLTEKQLISLRKIFKEHGGKDST